MTDGVVDINDYNLLREHPEYAYNMDSDPVVNAADSEILMQAIKLAIHAF